MYSEEQPPPLGPGSSGSHSPLHRPTDGTPWGTPRVLSPLGNQHWEAKQHQEQPQRSITSGIQSETNYVRKDTDCSPDIIFMGYKRRQNNLWAQALRGCRIRKDKEKRQLPRLCVEWSQRGRSGGGRAGKWDERLCIPISQNYVVHNLRSLKLPYGSPTDIKGHRLLLVAHLNLLTTVAGDDLGTVTLEPWLWPPTSRRLIKSNMLNNFGFFLFFFSLLESSQPKLADV